MIIKAKIKTEARGVESVNILVTDLDAFFHAGPRDPIFVYMDEGPFSIVKKQVFDLKIENS